MYFYATQVNRTQRSEWNKSVLKDNTKKIWLIMWLQNTPFSEAYWPIGLTTFLHPMSMVCFSLSKCRRPHTVSLPMYESLTLYSEAQRGSRAWSHRSCSGHTGSSSAHQSLKHFRGGDGGEGGESKYNYSNSPNPKCISLQKCMAVPKTDIKDVDTKGTKG